MTDPESPAERPVRQVSDAIEKKFAEGTLADRINDAWTWVLVDANRLGLVAALAAVVYATVVLVGAFGPVTQRQFLLGGIVGGKAYVELQTGAVTVITIVLAINQLVLSPDLGPLGRQHDRLSDAVSHRAEIADVTGVAPAPTEPSQALAALATATSRRASELRDAVATGEAPDLEREVTEFTDHVAAEADRIAEVLSREQFGRIGMIGAAMHYDASRDSYQVQRFRQEYDDDLSDAQCEALDGLLDVLRVFTVSREHFRTLYVRNEFIDFTRVVLYTAVPALVVAHLAVQIIGPTAFPGSTLGVSNLLWFASGTFTVSIVPVLVLVSYVARLATLAETSLFIGPFMPGVDDVEAGERNWER